MLLVGLAIPKSGFMLERLQIREPSCAETLTCVKIKLNFRLIEPAPMFGCVVYRESIPQAAPLLLAEVVRNALEAV